MSTKQIDIRVGNLDCEHDAAAIERGLTGFVGLDDLRVYPKSAKVSLAYDPAATSPEALKEKLDTMGFPPQAGFSMPEQPKPWRNPKVLTSVASGVLLLVGWYWLFPWFFLTRETPPSNELLFLAIATHTWGITWMIAADCQKFFQLKYHKGMMTDGMFRYTRNPNFFGEILIYVSYAMLANHWLSWIVFGYAVFYFYIRMLVKDGSISRYPDWAAYEAGSSRLLPWRILTAPFVARH